MKSRLLISLSVLFAGVLVLTACGGSSGGTSNTTTAGDAVAGKTAFEGTCVTCHGIDAKGLPGLGKDLTTSEFVKGKNDADLVAFIKQGRPTSDPLSTTGVDMPPRGGNPALSDADLANIVAYIRTLNK